MKKCIPSAEIFSRKGVPLKKVVKQAIAKSYTDLIVVHEDQKKPSECSREGMRKGEIRLFVMIVLFRRHHILPSSRGTDSVF